MSPGERLNLLLFLAAFFGASGFLSMLLSCGTQYWLLASESCDPADDRAGMEDGRPDFHRHAENKVVGGGRFFHEGLFWRCSVWTSADRRSVWNLWISNQQSSKVCEAAFLFPFPVFEPIRTQLQPHSLPLQPTESDKAIVFRTFWSIFLILGVCSVVIGGFAVICAAPLSNPRLYRAGGVLQACGGVFLLAVMLMFVLWVQVFDTLEQFVLHQRASRCSSLHLTISHGPSFFFAPVSVVFSLLSGLLFILAGRRVRMVQKERNGLPPVSPGG